jgi:hypothetical protein
MDGISRPRVYVHVGAAKTGTTYLQHLLWRHREALREDGVLYPGEVEQAHFWASQDLRGTRFRGHRDPNVTGAWERLVAEMRAWGGTAVVDHETLAPASEAHVDRAMGDLDFAEVHLVFTARDMGRQVPAMWQESLKNGDRVTFADYLHDVYVADAPGRFGRRFWDLQDVPAILARWSRALPPERVHVVTVPPAGADPGLLWQRFAGLLGLDPQRYDAASGGANTSLGAAEATVLRRLNVRLEGTGLPWPAYAGGVKFHLAPSLGARKGARIALPREAYDWAVAWSGRVVPRLAEAGYDVVGDLAELEPGPPVEGVDPDLVPDAEQLSVALEGMASLLDLWWDGGRLPDMRRRLEEAERALAEHRDLRPWARVRRCLVELAGQVRGMGALHRAYRRLRRRGGTG